jgi:hypothetical protein
MPCIRHNGTYIWAFGWGNLTRWTFGFYVPLLAGGSMSCIERDKKNDSNFQGSLAGEHIDALMMGIG